MKAQAVAKRYKLAQNDMHQNEANMSLRLDVRKSNKLRARTMREMRKTKGPRASTNHKGKQQPVHADMPSCYQHTSRGGKTKVCSAQNMKTTQHKNSKEACNARLTDDPSIAHLPRASRHTHTHTHTHCANHQQTNLRPTSNLCNKTPNDDIFFTHLTKQPVLQNKRRHMIRMGVFIKSLERYSLGTHHSLSIAPPPAQSDRYFSALIFTHPCTLPFWFRLCHKCLRAKLHQPQLAAWS